MKTIKYFFIVLSLSFFCIGNNVFCKDKDTPISDKIIFTKNDEEFTFKDTNGKTLFTKKLKRCYSFNEGYAVVVLENFDYAILDENGNISDVHFELLGQKFSEGKNFALFLDMSTGCIDTKGNLLFKIQIDWKEYGVLEVTPFSNGKALIMEAKDKWILIDDKGNKLKEFNFYHACEFKNGLSRVYFKAGNSLRFNYLNLDGDFISPVNFDEAEDFVNNHAHVKIGKDDFYIDTKGNKVSELKY